jgi:hypothetical protein
MKICSKCKVEKPVSEYYKHNSNKDGLQGQCKSCMKEKSTQWAKNNPDKIKKIIHKYHTKKQGIYEWYDGDISLYIGQSKRLLNRISNHKSYFNNPELAKKETQHFLYPLLQQHENASIRIIEECSPEVLLEREQYYINKLKPKYNTYE